MSAPKAEQVVYGQDARPALLSDGNAITARKTARIIAVKQDKDFLVFTEHGPIGGVAGDWLATNHPSDDPGADIWPISAERMKATYELSAPHPGESHRFDTTCRGCGEPGQLFVAVLGPNEQATISERDS